MAAHYAMEPTLPERSFTVPPDGEGFGRRRGEVSRHRGLRVRGKLLTCVQPVEWSKVRGRHPFPTERHCRPLRLRA